MAQEYELNYDEKEPREKKDQQETKEEALGDVYDIYGMVSNVHSRITGMTRDYVLAQYTSEVINAKFPKFVREQRKTLRVIKAYMITPLSTLEEKYQRQEAERIHKILTKVYKDVEELLLGELDEMVIISRAGKGEVTKAMLLHGRTKEERDEYNQDVTGQGIKEKLMEKSK